MELRRGDVEWSAGWECVAEARIEWQQVNIVYGQVVTQSRRLAVASVDQSSAVEPKIKKMYTVSRIWIRTIFPDQIWHGG